jgi:lysophospholipase L1-like esterase
MKASFGYARFAAQAAVTVTLPLVCWFVLGDRYAVPALFMAPLLALCSGHALAVLAVVFTIVLTAGPLADFPYTAEALFAVTVASGAALFIRGRLFGRATGPGLSFDIRSPAMAKFARPVALSCALVLIAFALFRGTPLLSLLILAGAYAVVYAGLRRVAPPGHAGRPRTALANAAVVAVSCLLGAAILEIGTRLFTSVLIPPPPSMDVIEADDATLWAPRPSTEREYEIQIRKNATKRFTIHHSSQGMRGPEIPEKGPGELRIALVGDSFTYGWGVNDDDTIALQLQELAATRHEGPVAVLNLGVSGFTAWQELLFLEKRGLPLKPDVVVLQAFPDNDVPDTPFKRGEVLPVFGEAELQHALTWKAYSSWRVRWDRQLRAYCAVYNLYRTKRPAWPSFTSVIGRLRFVPRPRDIASFERSSKRVYWLEVLLQDWYPQLEKAWQEYQQDVLKIAAVCEREGIAFYVYSMPTQLFAEQSWNRVFNLSRRVSGEDVEYEPHKDSRIAQEFFEEQRLPWIPLLEEFKRQENPERLFIPNDGHLNEQGSQFVATLLLNRLIRDGHLDGPVVEWKPVSTETGAS